MGEYTPETGEVRQAYIAENYTGHPEDEADAAAEFDRWLQDHDRKTRLDDLRWFRRVLIADQIEQPDMTDVVDRLNDGIDEYEED